MKKLALLPIILLISASMVIGVSFAESKFEHKQEVKKSQTTAPANEKTTKYEQREAARKNTKYADQTPNVKTTFQLKQEAKKIEAKKQTKIEVDKTKLEHKQETKKLKATAPPNEKMTKFEHREAIRKSQQ